MGATYCTSGNCRKCCVLVRLITASIDRAARRLDDLSLRCDSSVSAAGIEGNRLLAFAPSDRDGFRAAVTDWHRAVRDCLPVLAGGHVVMRLPRAGVLRPSSLQPDLGYRRYGARRARMSRAGGSFSTISAQTRVAPCGCSTPTGGANVP
jgi:hypothetical protein